MDSLAALRLQIEWGADEALGDLPRNHLRPKPALHPVSPVLAQQPAVIARSQSPTVLADTIDALHAALDAFDGCPLRATATTTVRPAGNAATKLVLIADAPGADDDRAGVAFAGPAGQTLDRVLGSAGLDRSALLLTYLVPWRPPGGRAPTDAEIQACLPFVFRLLQLVRPERLLLLGSAAVRAMTGSNDSIRRLRGRWLQATPPGFDTPLPAFAMLPLDQWLRTPAAKRDSWADLLALRSSLQPNP